VELYREGARDARKNAFITPLGLPLARGGAEGSFTTFAPWRFKEFDPEYFEIEEPLA